ncbi:MAG: phage portal protein [Campylobacteraceae bacterium]|nr:phage portal protein [Campylobacteraceae bacterium]
MESAKVIKGISSEQIVTVDKLASFNGIIEPFFDFDKVLKLYYANPYHRLCINIKSRVLSLSEESDLEKYLPNSTVKRFLRDSIRDLEIFGNMFTEIEGAGKYRAFYYMPAREARLDNDFKIYQVNGYKKKEIPGSYYSYSSPMSRHYGEPDYLASINQILTVQDINLYNNLFFKNGATPRLAVIFENSEPTQEQIDAFSEFFGSSFRGVENAHKTLIISSGTNLEGKDAKIRVEKLSADDDLSFEKLREISRNEIIAAHSVPPRLVGIVNTGGWGGQSELIGQLHLFNETVIKPKQEEIEEYFGSLGVKLVLKPFDITNFKDDSEVLPNLIQAGILSVAEAREILGWQKNIAGINNGNKDV